jgi:hypothetical protein
MGRRRWMVLSGTLLVGALLLAIVVNGALGSTVSSAAFTGGSGTVSVGGTLYAKNGGALTLTVNTSTDTKCVDVTDETSARIGHQTSSTAKSTWTFSFTAGTGEGVKTVTATARPDFNQNNCNGQAGSQQASYILDNTGPAVSAVLAPAPNGAGWNNSNVGLTWTASDVGSGVGSGPTPATDSVTSNAASVVKTSTATDRLGNLGTGSKTVKLDKTAPSISGARSPVANANGWNNTDVTVSFTCSDALAGIKSCPGPQTVSSQGANQSVSGQAVDNADNSASTSVGSISIDKTAPTLKGAPTTNPNGNGWYNGTVKIHWTCTDALSGPGTCPADSTIGSEGQNQTATASLSDRAGNTTTASSSPAVNIDTTAPATNASADGAWNNSDVTVTLDGNDALSGRAATYFTVDGGARQTYDGQTNKPSFTAQGIYTLEFWTVDNAGNEEQHKTVQVKIDKTPPTITHLLTPAMNANGWNKADTTVHFICGDEGGSGIKSCTSDKVISNEGSNPVAGTAEDNAGNSALDQFVLLLDKTPPTIKASADRAPNANGWYDANVMVSFACADVLSGVDKCPPGQELGEGANQSASGTAADAAGNTASDGVTDIDVDKSAPTLTGAATNGPNANGWYDGDVVIGWTCADALSSLDGGCPANTTVTGEGDNLSASESVSDRAGNQKNTTVDGIKIDRTAPTTSAKVPDPLESGWYAGDVKLTLDADDALSGVDKIFYSVDGGAPQTYADAFNFTAKGVHEIRFWSVDRAGNVEDRTAPGHSITLRIDGVPPSITGSRLPDANGFGWNNTPVTVTFDCSDAESGIAGCTPPVTLENEGAGQSVDGTALDGAGNTSDTTVKDINIDRTAPALSGAPTTDANGAGWYRGDVAIHWTATDGLSGIDPATSPADDVIAGEGSNLGAGPVSVSDKAGNSASQSVSGIKIDRNGPAINGAPTTSPNAAGWYNKDVIVGFSCTDPKLADGTNGSGVASCPSDKLLSGDGVNQSVTSDPAKDLAGNPTAGKTVGGINIDGHEPQTTANNVCTAKNNYCSGSTATVVLAATDVGPSGVKEIHYRVNDGAEQVATGSSVNVNIPLDGSGAANVSYYAVDKAGNVEPTGNAALAYDNIAPMVTHTLNPAANAADWNRADTTVHFIAKDDDGGSGVDASTITPDTVVNVETAAKVVNGEALDLAGNRGTDSVTVKLDKTPPTVSGATTTSPNSSGWYAGPVRVHFTCSDALSNTAVCPDDVTLSANGANQSVTGTAIDYAGNTRSTTVSGINIDADPPSINVNGIKDGGIYTLGAVPSPSCTADDGFSGVSGGCSVAVSGGLANGVGTFSYKATATDKAGNTATVTGSYRVVYRFDGFLQPINDTAHQVDVSTSVFKGGSTVPVKFQLKRADGTVVQGNTAPVWQAPTKGSATTAAVDESVYSAPADSASAYRWDSPQYIYNWGTSGLVKNYYYRIGVRLDDGQTYFVNIALR